MGTAILKLQKEKLRGRGVGRLTQDKCMKLQTYYRYNIKNNVGDADAMRSAVWASLFHCMSTDENPHHTRCPATTDLWCFYQKALANGGVAESHERMKTVISYEVAREILPVYTWMSDVNLLKRLSKGKTQNPNESLHSMIWSRCSITTFVGKGRIEASAAAAIASFNEGARSLTEMMAQLNCEANEVTMTIVDMLHMKPGSKKEKLSRNTKRERELRIY